MCLLSSSPGLQPVQVWPYKDLLSRWTSSLSGEASSGSTERSLRDDSETRPWMEPQEEIPEDTRGGHHPPAVHPREEDDPVRARHSTQSFAVALHCKTKQSFVKLSVKR